MWKNRDMGTPSGFSSRARHWQYNPALMFFLCVSIGIVVCGWSEAIGGETARPTAKDLPTTGADGMDPVTKFLLDDALAQGRISKQRYAALMRDYEEQAYARQPAFKFWYDRGFNLSTNDNAFLLRFRGRFSVQYTQRRRNEAWRDPGDAKNFPDIIGVFGDYRVNRADTQDLSTISLRRARLLFMGHVYSPDLKYFVQIGADSTTANNQTQPNVQLLDYFGQFTMFNWAWAQLGQYKVYFNRAQINSTASMQFAERALVMDAFTASGLDRRDIGVSVQNDEEVCRMHSHRAVV